MGNIIGIQLSCDQVVNGCCNCFGKYVIYVHNLEENVKALQNALQRLQELRDDVTTRVRVCESKGLQPLATVQGWLLRVRKMEYQVSDLLIRKTQEIDRMCVNGCCSKNWIASYRYGINVASKLREVGDLTMENYFLEVGQEAPRPIVDERSIGTTIGLDAMLKDVWRCLMEDKVGILGLYGMGGVGKTTLLTRINNKFLEASNNFDTVIWVSVSKEVQILRVQDDIGKKLGLFNDNWERFRQEEKALNIFRRLKNKKFVLLLDDIWTRVDLTEIGIPVPNTENGCKIVFNTRSQEICGLMEADETIEVKCLEWQYAWDLFQRKVGKKIERTDQEIFECAQSIARRCRGLPLALTAIGLSLRSKTTVKEWKRAVDDLTNSLKGFRDMENADHAILPLLKFSFDVIKDKKVQSGFLYCALFPEDYSIEKDELVDYWIGEGILGGYTDRNEAEERGYEIIGNLVRASLLMEEGRHVRMHDVIRQMALWIASDCKRNMDYSILCTHDRANEISVKKRKAARRVSLMNNKITGITSYSSSNDKIKDITLSLFPNLLTLIARGNIFSLISDGFFQSLRGLKVLDLSQNQDLVELQEEMSELVSLRYLNLSWTRVRALPESFSKLVKLMYLNLENTIQCKEIGVVSSLHNLQTLKLYNCGFFAEPQESKPSLEDLAGLKCLKVLTICVVDHVALKRLLSFPVLTDSARLLSLQKFEKPDSLEILPLTVMAGLQSLVINASCVTRGDELSRNPSFRDLCNVTVECCPSLQDLTWLRLVPNLTHLTLYELRSMEEVIRDREYVNIDTEGFEPFLNLKTLTLMYLPRLSSINPRPLLFPCLEHITVVECPSLDRLPLQYGSAMGRNLVIQGSKSWIKSLIWEDLDARYAFTLSY